MGLANMNQVSVSMLCRENLLQCLFRDYGGAKTGAGNSFGQGGLDANTVTSRIVQSTARIMCTYYRLAPQREIPASFACKIFRPMLSLGPAMPAAADANQRRR